MQASPDDTIAAVASAAGPGGRGIVRLSGPDCRTVLDKVFVPADRAAWEQAATARQHHGTLHLVPRDVALPATVCYWPGGRSYTGEPLAEIHTVSSPPLLAGLLADIYQSGARPARAGEFTLRSFLSGRIDLMQAEAVLGVIDADDQRQLERALRQLAGGISGPLSRVREDLLNLLADLEAGLDFVEEDISFVGRAETAERLEQAREVVAKLLSQADARMQSTGRRRVVLAGLPNAGKSTLFNALVERDAALVSSVPGTTRDYLRGEADWHGLPVELIDTAGRDFSAHAIENAAQESAFEQLEQADLIVWCTAADLDSPGVSTDDALIVELSSRNRPLLRVLTKCDLSRAPNSFDDVQSANDMPAVSAEAGSGLNELRRTIASRLAEDMNGKGSDELLGTTAARCHESLSGTIESLSRAQLAAEAGTGDEIVALELREALDHLARILGTIYTDDILDRVFSRFCIGK